METQDSRSVMLLKQGNKIFYWTIFFIFLYYPRLNATLFKSKPSPPPNFFVVDSHVLRGAQPAYHHVQWLHQQGVNTIIKLDDENKKEFDWGIAINWFHINKFGLNLSYGLIKNILHSLYRSMHWGKVYIHCEKGADRTGLVIALYRITRGWSVEQAWQEMNHPRFGHSSLQVWIDYKFFEYAERLQNELNKISF